VVLHLAPEKKKKKKKACNFTFNVDHIIQYFLCCTGLPGFTFKREVRCMSVAFTVQNCVFLK
jgi:hypothetical protein